MNDVLVVVYSWNAPTRGVGIEIARRLDCPIAEILEPKPRDGALAYLRSAIEAFSGCTPEIGRFPRNLREFPMLVVGTPVWMGHVSSPMRTFIGQYRDKIRQLCAFCTMDGRDPARTFLDIASVSGKILPVTLAVSERELGTSQHAARIEEFVAAIHALRPER